MIDLSTAGNIIDALGGTGAVAERFGIRSSAVSMWRATGIPIARRFEVARALREMGFTIPDDFPEKGVAA